MALLLLLLLMIAGELSRRLLGKGGYSCRDTIPDDCLYTGTGPCRLGCLLPRCSQRALKQVHLLLQ